MLFKETVIPTGSSPAVFFLAPMVTFCLALIAWAVMPVASGWVISDLNVGVAVLRRFVVTTDYAGHAAWLLPAAGAR